MDENITLSFDAEEKSPRLAEDILLDLSTARELEKEVDIGDGLILSKPVTEDATIIKDEINSNIHDKDEDNIRNDEVPYTINEPDVNIIMNHSESHSTESTQNGILNFSHENAKEHVQDVEIVVENVVESGNELQKIDARNADNVARQSVEFSDVLSSKNDSTVSSHDGFTSIVIGGVQNEAEQSVQNEAEQSVQNEAEETVQNEKEQSKDVEFEGEADIDLDNIKMQEKERESDSGSEFDFELPAVKPKQPEATINTAIHDTDEQQPKQSFQKSEEVKQSQESQQQIEQASTNMQSQPMEINEAEIKSTDPIQPSQVNNKSERVLEAAKNEWENVTTIQAGYMEGQQQGAEPTIVETLTPMSPYEMTQVIQKEDFTNVKSNIRSSVERKGFAAFVNFLFGPPKLKRPLIEERDRIFCVAATPLSNDSSNHLRTLQTIYRSLTGSKFDCRRFGNHWEEIGFQGTDPSTDLRSVGILGLVNLLFFLKTPRTQALASDIYRLSLHPTQNFPFCVMGINMTRITIQILREDLLNKECNKRGVVLGVVTEFYAGLYLLLYQIWKGQGKTISDSGFVIKDIEIKARKNTNDIFKNLEDYFTKKKTVITDVSPGIETENLQFVNVCEDK